MISVIIPVYNVKECLSVCVDSALGQSYENIEIILVDDGSTDGSSALCDDYAVLDSRVRVIHRENGGLSAARNSGIDLAQGEYIYFLDGDDAIHPKTLEFLIGAIEANNADLAFCNLREFNDGEAVPYEVALSKADTQVYSGRETLLLSSPLMKRLSVVAWNKLYKKEHFATLRYPEGRILEDAATTYKVLYDLVKVVYVPQELCFYRQRATSIMNSGSQAKRNRHHMMAFLEQATFYESRGDKELELLAYDRYESNLAELIITLRNEETSSREELKQLKNQYRKILTTKLSGPETSKSTKLKLRLFLLSEKLYDKVRKIRH